MANIAAILPGLGGITVMDAMPLADLIVWHAEAVARAPKQE